MDVAAEAYKITSRFPKQEIYGAVTQIRRAGASIPANIAEGYGRESKGSYVQFLRIAQGSLKELETHLMLAARVELTSQESVIPLLEHCDTVGKMLRGLIRSLDAAD